MPYIPRAVLNELWSDANCNILEDKSFADDLNLERGIVNSREALLPRAIEIHPLFSDLFAKRIRLGAQCTFKTYILSIQSSLC